MGEGSLTLKSVEALRNERYHRRRDIRLTSEDAIRRFVNDAGVCLLFPAQGIEMPNVYQAVAGFAKGMTAKHNDPAISLTWGTKDRSLNQRWWYYGKLLKGKATLVSLDLLPSFYALSENFGTDDDYLLEYEAGTLSNDAKNIYEALLRHGPMHAIELKRKSNLYGDEVKAKFDKALGELQAGLKVLPVGVAEAGAWRYAFIYDIVSRWLPEQTKAAQNISRSDARVNILSRHVRNVVMAETKTLARIFNWKVAEVDAALRKLVERGEVSMGEHVKGVKGDVVVVVM
jgi:hypothetical protein